jgi:hypothetical protein
MRYVVVLTLWIFVGCGPPEAPVEESAEADVFLDPVMADGEHYALEFENDYVRVLREKLPAGEAGAMHSHRDRVSVYLNDAGVTITPQEGEPTTANLVAGSSSWGGATTHRGKAADDLENLSIELHELDGADVPTPEPDAVEVDPEHHTVDFENERVRVVRMTYPPGFKTPLHGHRVGFGVFLTDAHGQNLPEEGEPIAIDADARSTFWTTGQPVHVTENLSDEELVVLLVEMKKVFAVAPE